MKEEGSSLIEVIVALFLLVVLFVLYASALNTVTLSRKLRSEDIAYHVANKEMEVLRETPFNSLPANGVHTFSDSLLNVIPQGAASYTISDYVSFTGMKEIVVDVTWNDGIARTAELRTLSGSGGINP